MKRLKSGFTLAEVLITLGIIGVVAAIILPSVMSNYQYKSVGVKLAKFVSTLEGAARPYAINNDNLSKGDKNADSSYDTGDKENPSASYTTYQSNAEDFINEAFIFKAFDPAEFTTTKKDGASSTVKTLSYPALTEKKLTSDTYAVQDGKPDVPIAILKDGTAVQFYLDDTAYTGDHEELIPVEKFGAPVVRVNFDPKVQGLPQSARKNFNFTVTELGYVFPHENDSCAWRLYNGNFTTTSKDFAAGTACHID